MKSQNAEKSFEAAGVSLFTREWIEIGRVADFFDLVFVSLFTREWIEIIIVVQLLKSCVKGLPLYEGVD